MSSRNGDMKKQEFKKLVGRVKRAGNIRRGEMVAGPIFVKHSSGFRSVGLTDLRRKTSKVLEFIKDSIEPLFITRRGKVVAVLLSMKAYLKLERDGRLLRIIARGKQGAGKQVKKRMYRLEDLNAGITEKDLHKEVSFVSPVGREVW